jgi:type IV pilus assembly protein PilY1
LQAQTITYEGTATTVGGTATTNPIVVVSQNSVCYAATSTGCAGSSPLKKGWALDLLNPNYSPPKNAVGERVVSFPIVRQGIVLFSTLIPNPNECGLGGTSHLMTVGTLSGGASSTAPFDTNGNGVVDSNDLVTVTIGGVSSTVAASGVDLLIGIINTPTIIETSFAKTSFASGSSGVGVEVPLVGGAGAFAYASGSTGGMADVALPGTSTGSGGSGGSGRQSWRQLQ